MKTVRFLICLLAVLITGCSTWTELTKDESTFFTDKEKIILQETTSAVNFSYGYETDLEIDYVYKAGKFSDSAARLKSGEMKKALAKYSSAEMISFYEKIYTMKEIALWKKKEFREDEEWGRFTLLENYLLPEIKLFTDILENSVLSLAPEYRASVEKRKNEIKRRVADKLS